MKVCTHPIAPCEGGATPQNLFYFSVISVLLYVFREGLSGHSFDLRRRGCLCGEKSRHVGMNVISLRLNHGANSYAFGSDKSRGSGRDWLSCVVMPFEKKPGWLQPVAIQKVVRSICWLLRGSVFHFSELSCNFSEVCFFCPLPSRSQFFMEK